MGKQKTDSGNNDEAGPEIFQLVTPDQINYDKNWDGGLNLEDNLN